MEKKETDWVLNPKTNRFIKKGSPTHVRLIKEGLLSENTPYKPPALVVEKKVKAVANVKDLSKSEIDDIYDQIKALRLKRDAIVDRRSSGRPIGTMGDKDRPKFKEEMKITKKQPFNVKVTPSKKQDDTEYEITDADA